MILFSTASVYLMLMNVIQELYQYILFVRLSKSNVMRTETILRETTNSILILKTQLSNRRIRLDVRPMGTKSIIKFVLRE